MKTYRCSRCGRKFKFMKKRYVLYDNVFCSHCLKLINEKRKKSYIYW
jgi:DNA-directed RNA polymerase subunit RPC12/RpoP